MRRSRRSSSRSIGVLLGAIPRRGARGALMGRPE
jgi:hypothetical protein